MNSKEPAFPLVETEAVRESVSLGLTKREYFAGLAMQGLISKTGFTTTYENKQKNLAQEAVKFADSLLSELEL